MLYTGLRRGEAVALRWKDIDFERGIITVSRAAVYIGNRTTQIGDTKTKAGHRKLPLLPILREQLGTPGAPDNYVLYNRTTPLPYTSIKRHWTQLQEDIPAMADATPHRLRHTYLLLLRRAGVDAATQPPFPRADRTKKRRVSTAFLPTTRAHFPAAAYYIRSSSIHSYTTYSVFFAFTSHFGAWGSRGRKFESSHPDIEAIAKSLLFLRSGVNFCLLRLCFMPYSTYFRN